MTENGKWDELNKPRPRYFPGRYLLAEDFENQHNYLYERQRYLNRSLHVSGVIEGLKVNFKKNTNNNEVEISPGSALDEDGHLIVLDRTVDVPVKQGDYVYICWKEDEQDKEDSGENRNKKPGYETGANQSPPKSSVKLGKVVVDDEGNVKIEESKHQYSGISLPNSDIESTQSYTIRYWQDGDGAWQGVEIDGALKISKSLVVSDEKAPCITFTRKERKKDDNCELKYGAGEKLVVTRALQVQNELEIVVPNETESTKTTIYKFTTDDISERNKNVIPTARAIIKYVEDRHRVYGSKERQFHLGHGRMLRMLRIPAKGQVFDIGVLHGAGSHKVEFTKDFYIGMYPVTNGEYLEVMGSYDMSEEEIKKDNDRGDYPRDAISYPRITEKEKGFLATLNRLSKRQGWAVEFRLPSETEWEFACRADTTGAYYYGNDEESLRYFAQYYERPESPSGLAPVGGDRNPNAWGLYDTLGNVWELCADGWGEITSLPKDGTPRRIDGGYTVMRGGSYNSPRQVCTCASRHKYEFGSGASSIGFRVACSETQAEPQRSDREEVPDRQRDNSARGGCQ